MVRLGVKIHSWIVESFFSMFYVTMATHPATVMSPAEKYPPCWMHQGVRSEKGLNYSRLWQSNWSFTSKGVTWVFYKISQGIFLRFFFCTFYLRFSKNIQLVKELGVDPEHAAKITYLTRQLKKQYWRKGHLGPVQQDMRFDISGLFLGDLA